MKNKILKIGFILCILIICLMPLSNATSTKKQNVQNTQNEITEEDIQTMVDQKVETAVNGAVEELKSNSEPEEKSNGVGLIAAAVATGLACIGAGIAVAVVASSAVGAISENPSLLGKTIIFAGLAEGIAIYGLIIAIMILNKI